MAHEMNPYLDATILIVDDQQDNIDLIETFLLDEGYTNFVSTTDSRQAVPRFESEQPDLLLLDLHMPGLDGFAVMRALKERITPQEFFPILVLTADIGTEIKQRALTEGAHDFLTKPLDVTEVLLRIRNLLATRFLHRALQTQNSQLEERVRARTADLSRAQLETLERLALAAEYRDDDTGRHTKRVGHTSALLAQALGLSCADVDSYLRAAPLHDVGKIGVPDHILLKPGRLTTEEFDVIKTHTGIGAKILGGSDSVFLQLAEEIALYHHERWDGTGYGGLKGVAIPLSGRILTVADVFDALTHERPYKNAWPVAAALTEIQSCSGKQFDPAVVEAFMTLPHESLV